MTEGAAPVRPGRVYGGRSPEERRADRRRRLLDAGLESFGTVGYPATSIEQLCADARVTPRHFYEEFSGREALLQAVFDEVTTQAAQDVGRALSAAPADVRAKVVAGLTAFVDTLVRDPRRVRVTCVEIVGVSAHLERHRRRVLHLFADAVGAQTQILIDAGALPPLSGAMSALKPEDRRLRTLTLVGGTQELVVEWLLRDEQQPVEVLLTVLTDVWMSVLGVPDRRAEPR